MMESIVARCLCSQYGIKLTVFHFRVSLDYSPHNQIILVMLIYRLVSIITSVEVTSNKSNSIHPIGSDVELTCIVELNEALNVSVIVKIYWTGPNNHQFNDTQTSIEMTNGYTSTNLIESLSRENSGNYTCLATVTAMATLPHLTDYNDEASNSTLITTGTPIQFVIQSFF